MSLATTIAIGAYRAARQKWDAHKKTCNDCHRAAQQRRPGRRCASGQELASAMHGAEVAARRETELDRAPAIGQGALFGQSDLFA